MTPRWRCCGQAKGTDPFETIGAMRWELVTDSGGEPGETAEL